MMLSHISKSSNMAENINLHSTYNHSQFHGYKEFETSDDEQLRLRRELVNAAVELVGFDKDRVEEYLKKKM